MGYTMKHKKGAFPFRTDLTKKPVGPRATKKKSDFEKMSYAEQEKYMNEEHHSIVPTFSDHMQDALNKKKSKKKK